MEKNNKLLSLLLGCIFCTFASQGQCLIPSGDANGQLPVTNRFNDSYFYINHLVDELGSSINKIVSSNGKYYVAGRFSNLNYNQGPALVVDSGTNNIRTPKQWRINGTVLTAVPDGQGGFYIGGDFTKIGDSSRKYIAQIGANGQPTAWNPQADNIVKMLQVRNDSLYIAGHFSKIFSRAKNCFAIYSIKGDSLVNTRLAGFEYINTFLLKRDSLIIGGKGLAPIRKYSIRDSLSLGSWVKYIEYGPVDMLRFSGDSSVVLYLSEYNEFHHHTLQAFTISTGLKKYSINMTMYWPDGFDTGILLGMKVAGNKAYVVGHFLDVRPPMGALKDRHGFFSFDANTGALTDETLPIDGFPSFIEIKNGKIYLSGKFDTVNAVPRQNFAVLDTGSLAVNAWQLSPSDGLTTLTFNNNGAAFIGGYFNGINATRRNGFAAIDSATGAILPFNPPYPYPRGIVKRMMVKGDTLFVLFVEHHLGCAEHDVTTSFHMYRISTSQPIPVPQTSARILDFNIDGDDLYISDERELRRFYIPNMVRDAVWGSRYAVDHVAMHLIVRDNRIYTVGDSRFYLSCTSHPTKKAWFITYDKATGLPVDTYSYVGYDPGYDVPAFDRALLVDDKLYIQGQFTKLNGIERKDFVCLDINTGNITGWKVDFGRTTMYPYSTYSDLKFHNRQIWFGATRYTNDQGKYFSGFFALDTMSGVFMPPTLELDYRTVVHASVEKSSQVSDFIFHDNNFIGVGSFDFVNRNPVTSITGLPLMPPASTLPGAATIVGADTILSDGKPKMFYVTPADTTSFAYNWTYTGTDLSIVNNGKDTVWVIANNQTPGGTLKTEAIGFCSAGPLAQKNIVVVAAPPPLPMPNATGIADKCFSAAHAVAKLQNPPAGAQVEVYLDGATTAYQASDSTFRYFTSGQTATGYHTVTVKYRYVTPIKDSIINNFFYYVLPVVVPGITIAGNTTVNEGNMTTLTATPSPIGSTPGYQWQDSTFSHSWQNIPGATGQQLAYAPDTTGVKARCILNSDNSCASPAVVISNTLSFTVNMVTGINDPNDRSKYIRVYPNPAPEIIVVDSLLLSSNWRTVEIMNMYGQKVIAPINIQNRIQISIPVKKLNKGVYVIVLRKKDGTMASAIFIKG